MSDNFDRAVKKPHPQKQAYIKRELKFVIITSSWRNTCRPVQSGGWARAPYTLSKIFKLEIRFHGAFRRHNGRNGRVALRNA